MNRTINGVIQAIDSSHLTRYVNWQVAIELMKDLNNRPNSNIFLCWPHGCYGPFFPRWLIISWAIMIYRATLAT